MPTRYIVHESAAPETSTTQVLRRCHRQREKSEHQERGQGHQSIVEKPLSVVSATFPTGADLP